MTPTFDFSGKTQNILFFIRQVFRIGYILPLQILISHFKSKSTFFGIWIAEYSLGIRWILKCHLNPSYDFPWKSSYLDQSQRLRSRWKPISPLKARSCEPVDENSIRSSLNSLLVTRNLFRVQLHRVRLVSTFQLKIRKSGCNAHFAKHSGDLCTLNPINNGMV